VDEASTISLNSLDTWEAWVAIGTLALALATGGLAYATRRLGSLARDELAAVREQTQVQQQQIAVSQSALAAAVRPVLIEKLPGAAPAKASVQPIDAEGKYVFEPAEAATVEEHGVYVAVQARNAGNGIAFVERCVFRWAEGGDFQGSWTSPLIPPGEWTDVFFELWRTVEGSPTVATLQAYGTFSVDVDYADLAGFDLEHPVRRALRRTPGRVFPPVKRKPSIPSTRTPALEHSSRKRNASRDWISSKLPTRRTEIRTLAAKSAVSPTAQSNSDRSGPRPGRCRPSGRSAPRSHPAGCSKPSRGRPFATARQPTRIQCGDGAHWAGDC
jgi:hypothetical protein